MFELLNLKDLVQVDERKVYTTNVVFILHCKVTVVLLLALSILVTSRQYLGDPIDCLSSSDIKSIADKYCWIHSTFTRAALISDGKWAYEAVEEDDLAPGIRPAIEGDKPRVYHTYYQWVWLVLFLQAGLFYIPYWLWRLWDRGRIKLLVSDLNLEVIMNFDDEKLARQKEAILHYLTPNGGRHTGYATQYVICEILNSIIVIMQIWLTDAFLNWHFSTYGLGVFKLTQKHPYQRRDELARVFPTVTACRIATGGVAFGTVEYDLLCVLNINILNEKIYVFLWFWFLGLAVFSLLNLIYRALLIMLPPLRRIMLRRRLKSNNYRNLAKQTSVVFECSYSDWFLLSKLADNLNPVVFAQILEELQDTLSNPSTMDSVVKRKLRGGSVVEDDNQRNARGSTIKRGSGVEQPEDEVMMPLNPKLPPPPQIPIKFLSSSQPASHRQ